MKLYRGLKGGEFEEWSAEVEELLSVNWRPILEQRAQGNLRYPKAFAENISQLKVLTKFEDQYFTDRKEVAEKYARTGHGVLIEIDLSVEDILDHFKVEFQNFSKRLTCFELVYRVHGRTLSENAARWKLQQFHF